MKDGQNITIVLLAVTAVILAALLISDFISTPAYADTPVKEGDYILGTGAASRSTDLIYIIDIANRQLNVYVANINTNAIDIVDTVDLERAFRR